jgi:N-acetylneuraminic acid mutarotase
MTMRSIALPVATLALALAACTPQQQIEPPPGGGTWQAMSNEGAPRPRTSHVAVWTGSEMIVWGGIDPQEGTRWGDGARYRPDTDSWTAMSNTDAPLPRVGHSGVATDGRRVLIWGGIANDPLLGLVTTATGGSYDPGTDSWAPLSQTGAPAARSGHLSVWTGSEMIVWGGIDETQQRLNAGGVYNPTTDTWRSMATANAPVWSPGFTAVWSGSEMIIWGMTGSAQSVPSGARYDPATDAWRSMDEEGAPVIPFHGAVWSGFEMIVLGTSEEGIGARYNPVPDTWSYTVRFDEPAGDVDWSYVWSGSELLAWGGYRRQGTSLTPLGTGGRYHPLMDTWTPMATAGAPAARGDHTAIWTGTQMIVWGGSEDNGSTGTGGRYTP